MTFGAVERPMFVELFGTLVGLDAEWASEGATPEEIDLTAFDWDYVSVVDCGGFAGPRGDKAPRILEETEDHRIEIDRLGRKMKLIKKVATLPLPLDHPVSDMASWLALKPLFEFDDDRIDWEAVARAREEQQRGALVVGTIPGGFDMPRQLMGVEGACLSYHVQPELMRDVMNTMSDTAFKVFERVSDRLTIDQLSVHEDLAGKGGPLIGPDQFNAFIQPYYRRIWDLLSSRGARIFCIDTDGNVEPLIDGFLESGLTAFEPVEPAAGMDMVAIRKKTGRRLALKGGIDKYVLKRGREAIRKELEYKMQPVMREGGTVFGLDHRIPNGTPVELYRYYVNTGREILGLPPLNARNRGWRRMAF